MYTFWSRRLAQAGCLDPVCRDGGEGGGEGGTEGMRDGGMYDWFDFEEKF